MPKATIFFNPNNLHTKVGRIPREMPLSVSYYALAIVLEKQQAEAPPSLTQKAIATMAVISVGLGVFMVALGLGLGIGVLAGLWSSTLSFVTALLACENAALFVTGASAAVGVCGGMMSSFTFFKKEPMFKEETMLVVEAPSKRRDELSTSPDKPSKRRDEFSTSPDKPSTPRDLFAGSRDLAKMDTAHKARYVGTQSMAVSSQ